jgi:hypothetical protein
MAVSCPQNSFYIHPLIRKNELHQEILMSVSASKQFQTFTETKYKCCNNLKRLGEPFQHFGAVPTKIYRIHSNAGSSGFRMAISRTLFGSGFRMVLAAILLKNIRKPDFFVRFSNGWPSFYHLKARPDFFQLD